MSEPRTFLSNVNNFQNILNQNMKNTYALDITSFLKAFTTNTSGINIPHYELPINISGIDSIKLNPYGRNTLHEALVYGTGLPGDLDGNAGLVEQSRFDIRSLGIKNPMTIVGWGYDIFGYPSPNANSGWSSSGVYSITGNLPSNNFSSSGSLVSQTGSHVPFEKWNAGPLDLRWDEHRKVWTCNYGVYAAKITRAFNSSVPITDFNTPLFAENITYSAQIYDGPGSGIFVTGIAHSLQKPRAGTYKVYPVPIDAPCLLVHVPINNRPGFGIFTWESPFAEDCSATSSESVFADIESTITYANLSEESLATDFGGTGFDTYNEHEILIGNETGSLDKKTLTAGTGISVVYGSSNVTISISSGVSFTLGDGTNTSIHALSGLTTPLSISQGGTASSTKNFVDLSSNQSVSGIKNFISQTRFVNGSSSIPGIAFNTAGSWGLSYLNTGLNFIASGISVQSINPTGSVFNHSVLIAPTENYYPPLVVRQRSVLGFIDSSGGLRSAGSDVQQWQNASGNFISSIDFSGNYNGPGLNIYNNNNSNRITLRPATGNFNQDYSLLLPTGNGTLALVGQSVVSDSANHSHITERPSGTIDGINYEFYLSNTPDPQSSLLLFKQGLIQTSGYGEDYVSVSGNKILFSPDNLPQINDKLLCYYSITSIVSTHTHVNEIPVGSINGINSIFTLSNSPNPQSSLMLFKQGLIQCSGYGEDYVIVSGSKLVFESSNIPQSSDKLFCNYLI